MRTIRYICKGCKKNQTFDADETTVTVFKATTPITGREVFTTICPHCQTENAIEFEKNEG